VYTSFVLFLRVLPPCCLCSFRQTVFFIFIPTQDAEWNSRLVTLGSRAVPIFGIILLVFPVWAGIKLVLSTYFASCALITCAFIRMIARLCVRLHLLGGGSNIGFRDSFFGFMSWSSSETRFVIFVLSFVDWNRRLFKSHQVAPL